MLNRDDFYKKFEQTRKAAIVGSIINLVMGAGVLGFVAWVIVKVMQHFQII